MLVLSDVSEAYDVVVEEDCLIFRYNAPPAARRAHSKDSLTRWRPPLNSWSWMVWVPERPSMQCELDFDGTRLMRRASGGVPIVSVQGVLPRPAADPALVSHGHGPRDRDRHAAPRGGGSRRQVSRPARQWADGALLAGLASLLPRWRLGRFFVQPATLLRWHRELVRRRWTNPSRAPGRPPVPTRTVALVVRPAKENPDWGYRRIHGALATMGITIAASSVWPILKRHDIEPSPRRSGPSWAEFLAAQAKGLIVCDFLTAETVLLRRLYVLLFIHHDTRLARIAAVTAKPVTE